MRFPFALAIIVAVSGLSSGAAQALSARTWVSGHGVDQSGCGTAAAPCRTLQYAHDNTATGGEIDILDPAGYGSIVITKSISIVNDGVGVAGVLAPHLGNAIEIDAAYSFITLRGLTIEGANSGVNGIVLNAAQGLTVTNCTIENFIGQSASQGNGILIQHTPPSDPTILITHTTIQRNGYVGLFLNSERPAQIQLDYVTVTHNNYGVSLNLYGQGSTTANIRHSNISSNNSIGLDFAGNITTPVSIDSTTVWNNGINGIRNSNLTLLISNSVIVNSDIALEMDNTAYDINSPTGIIVSYQNNVLKHYTIGTLQKVTPF